MLLDHSGVLFLWLFSEIMQINKMEMGFLKSQLFHSSPEVMYPGGLYEACILCPMIRIIAISYKILNQVWLNLPFWFLPSWWLIGYLTAGLSFVCSI